jgi:hypothetical protein
MPEPALRQVLVLANGPCVRTAPEAGLRIEQLDREMPEQRISRVLFPFD